MREDFKTLVTQLSAVARSQTAVKGTAFLGPIGWLWNNVYYRVFSGNDVMMAALGRLGTLSPIILVFSIRWVMQGARAPRNPYVPEHRNASSWRRHFLRSLGSLLAAGAAGTRPLRRLRARRPWERSPSPISTGPRKHGRGNFIWALP